MTTARRPGRGTNRGAATAPVDVARRGVHADPDGAPDGAPDGGPVTAPTTEVVTNGRDHRVHLLREMLRIRRFEERCIELYSGSAIRGFLHLAIGEEACAVGVMAALTGDDAIVTTYREHGHALARGISMRATLAELEGKLEGASRGRGGSMHIFDAATRFYGGNAIVGGGLPLAVGLALADHLRSRRRVTACLFGDGAVAEGEFHESMNLAALWQLPVLFVCENNRYAMGTALERAQSETDLALKASSYRMPAWAVDGMDVLAVEEATRQAAAAVRGGRGPHFLELRTYRFRAHSMYDPDLYRDKAEIERWKERDPIPALIDRLTADGVLGQVEQERLEDEVRSEVDDAVAFAEAGTLEPVADLQRFVVSETVPPEVAP